MDAVCQGCGEGRVIVDPDSSIEVCNSCGREHSSDVFQSQMFSSDGRPLGSLHSIGDFGYRERKHYHAKAFISDLTSRFQLSASRAGDVCRLVSDVTSGEYGSGEWFSVLVAACSYVVTRRHRIPLSIAEVADAIGRETYEVGRMVSRITRHLDLGQLPEFDAVKSLERAVRTCPSLAGLEKEKAEEIIGQGRFLLQCAMKWFLTTGRQPLPMIAAVVALVAEVNGVRVKVEDIAKEIHAGVTTSQLRLKELIETLVRVARDLLPWGEDVTFKNLVHNAPLLIRFMELKSKSRLTSDGSQAFVSDWDDLLIMYSNSEEDDSKYFNVGAEEDYEALTGNELESVKISGERLSRAYNDLLDRLALLRDTGGLVNEQRNKRKRGVLEMEGLKGSWEGRWDSEKKLTLEQVLNKDVGYDALPPSFINCVESRKRRKMKIEAAKHRINQTMKLPSADNSGLAVKEKDLCSKPPIARKRRKGEAGIDGIDWEDCIIELLLLHRVNEEEIEQGQYSRLLDLHVFNSFTIKDEEYQISG